MMLKGLKELDKSIIRDPLTLTRPVPVLSPSRHSYYIFSLALCSIKALQASFKLYEARHGRLVNER
jgi:hypothetical protein